MSEIAAVFFSVVAYRYLCSMMNWQPFPLVQITINNRRERDND